jgi:aldehyde:ferredoxin oxidoreductase
MEYLASNKILVVDLTTGEISDQELDDELVSQRIGGVGITTSLYETYQNEDPIVLGAGPLTGTLFPGSALAVVTAKNPVTGAICHCPITQKAGMELKYTGFDYVVIKGSSQKPVFLWLHDGVADIDDAEALWGKDVWETTDHIRKAMGDDLIQTLVIGEAGESGSDFAQICINYWPSGDRFGFAKAFGQKRLKGIALRGMGLLEIADGEAFVDQCFELVQGVKGEEFNGKQGVEDILAALGEADVKEWLKPLVHRCNSCYNTPYPSNTFVYLDEDPGMVVEPAGSEPGFMITDPYALLAFKKAGLSAGDACFLLKACAKYGVDAVAVAELSAKAGETNPQSIIASFPNLKGPLATRQNGKFSPISPPQPIFADFGLDGDATASATWWERRQAAAYIFGLHPIFVNMSTELTEEKMLELTNLGAGLDLSRETLDKVIAAVNA